MNTLPLSCYKKLFKKNFTKAGHLKHNLLHLLGYYLCFEYILEDSGSAENKEILLFSHDNVKALFTSVPVQPAIQIVKNRLQQDNTLPQRTAMSIPQIISLLEFCLTQTYFLFQGKYYKQTQGAAMGSPISPLIANISWKSLKLKPYSPHPTHLPCG